MAGTAPHRIGWSELRREAGDPRPPGVLVIGITFAAQLAWAATVVTFGVSSLLGSIGAVAIATIAAWWLTIPASVAAAALSFLVADGFVQDQMGQLSWDGSHDTLLLLSLLVLSVIAASIHGELIDEARRHRVKESSGS
jgi:hypothetical protein